MANQTGNSGRQSGNQQQGPNRQNDRQQQDQQRSPGSSQQDDDSGKQAGTGIPEGEKIGEWSDDESSKKSGSSE
jgi:hypothetical protein